MILYPSLLFLLRLTEFHELPNGAVLIRKFEWRRWTRIDLHYSVFGERVASDVEYLCFDDEAILGTTRSTGPFVWSGRNAPIVRGNDPDYDVARRESGLLRDGGRCLGYFGAHVGAELLLRDPNYRWWTTTPGEHRGPGGELPRTRGSTPAEPPTN